MAKQVPTPAETDPSPPAVPGNPELDAEVIRASGLRVACDGGVHGHPQVWLNLGDDGRIVCPYCSRIFVLEGSRHDTSDDNGSN